MTNPFSFKKSMVAIAVIQALSINVSSAATIMVTNSSDSNAVAGCTLREAITSITDGAVSGGCVNTGTAFGTNDTINFSPNVNTVNLSAGQLSISDSSLSINEGGASVTIQGDSSDRIFNIESSVVSINNMTLLIALFLIIALVLVEVLILPVVV